MRIRRIDVKTAWTAADTRGWISSDGATDPRALAQERGDLLLACCEPSSGRVAALVSISSDGRASAYACAPMLSHAMPKIVSAIEARMSGSASSASPQPQRKNPQAQRSSQAQQRRHPYGTQPIARQDAQAGELRVGGHDPQPRSMPQRTPYFDAATPLRNGSDARTASLADDAGKRKKGGAIAAIVACIAVAALAVGGMAAFATGALDPVLRSLPFASDASQENGEDDRYRIPYDGTAELRIEAGEGTFDASLKLEELGFPEAADNLVDLVNGMSPGASIQAGTYTLYGSETPEDIADRLVHGKLSPYGLIGVNDGDEIRTIAAAIDADGTLPFNGDDFKAACASIGAYEADYDMLSAVPEGVSTIEGFIPPGVYRLRDCKSAEDAVRVMLDAGQRRYEDSGLDAEAFYEALTIGAMIEKEAGFDEDRPLISSVIRNRLAAGMTLSIDATVKYALQSDEARVTYNDTEVDSPYNTYMHTGLPIGPICCGISDESLEAALNPADTDYLYYVLSDKEGHHAFSSDDQQFEADRQRYLEIFGYTDDVDADEARAEGETNGDETPMQ